MKTSSRRRTLHVLALLLVALPLLTACGEDSTPTTWQDVALWAVIGAVIVGVAFAESRSR